ncbi:MAG: hypothetical protein R3B13_20445 [Polyangiaceae bacterium]
MKVIASHELKTCLDSTSNRALVLDAPITADLIRHLGALGRLEYFPTFARPFFRLTKRGCFVARGVQGSARFEVMFLQPHAQLEVELASHISSFSPPPGGPVQWEPS